MTATTTEPDTISTRISLGSTPGMRDARRVQKASASKSWGSIAIVNVMPISDLYAPPGVAGGYQGGGCGGASGGVGLCSGGGNGGHGGTRGGMAPRSGPAEPLVDTPANSALSAPANPMPSKGPRSKPSQSSVAATNGKITANVCQLRRGFQRLTGPSTMWYVATAKATDTATANTRTHPSSSPRRQRKMTNAGQWKR